MPFVAMFSLIVAGIALERPRFAAEPARLGRARLAQRALGVEGVERLDLRLARLDPREDSAHRFEGRERLLRKAFEERVSGQVGEIGHGRDSTMDCGHLRRNGAGPARPKLAALARPSGAAMTVPLSRGIGDMTPSKDIQRLLEIMAALRTPETGCPWDLEQDFSTIATYTLEEAYEVVDAIERDDIADLKDELGDLLLQVVFHARMAEEKETFAFEDVVEAITTKLVRRHPHVFGEARHLPAQEVKRLWDEIKQAEKAERRAARAAAGQKRGSGWRLPRRQSRPPSPPSPAPGSSPAKAAKVGFDWPDAEQVVAKIREELAEVEEAAAALGARSDRGRDRRPALRGHQPRAALRRRSRGGAAPDERKFDAAVRRHRGRARSERGRTLAEASLDEMERLWVEAKDRERNGAGVRLKVPRLREASEKPRLLALRSLILHDRPSSLGRFRGSRISAFSCSQASPWPSSGATLTS